MNSIKFLHLADAHLGYSQYSSETRYNDFNRAFNWILNKAIEESVDFVLLAGDLFNKKDTNPKILTDVYNIIASFKENSIEKCGAAIPVIAIEGNHDRPITASDSWLRFLANLDLIHVLSCEYDKEKNAVIFPKYDYEKKYGGIIEIKGVKIYGMQFFASLTPDLLTSIYDAINVENDQPCILMMHYGIDGQDPKKKGMIFGQKLEKLHEKVNYLALGHFHSMYELPEKNPWIFNPGSIERTDLTPYFNSGGKSAENDKNRGIYIAQLNEESKIPIFSRILCSKGSTDEEEHEEIPNRTFIKQRIKVPSLEANTWEEMENKILDRIKSLFNPREDEIIINPENLDYPTFSLSLMGEVPFSMSQVNIRSLQQKIESKFQVLAVRIYSKRLFSSLDSISDNFEKSSSKQDIEETVFKELITKWDKYSGKASEILEFSKELKSNLGNTAKYKNLKQYVNNWFDKNLKDDLIPSIDDGPENKDLENLEEFVDSILNNNTSNIEIDEIEEKEEKQKEQKTSNYTSEEITGTSDDDADDEEDLFEYED